MRYKDDNKKENIFHATIDLINEIGFSEISMSKIAKKAGVSASTIYIYFENKEDMINKLYLTIKQKMIEEIFKGVEGVPSIKAGFELALGNFVNFILNHENYFLFSEQFVNAPMIKHLKDQDQKNLFQPVWELFERGKAQGIFKPVSTELLIEFSYAPMIQLIKKHYSGEFNFDQQQINNVVAIIWDGITV